MIKILTLMTMLNFSSTTHKVTWYGGDWHGKKTASGEVFDKNKLTCAASEKYKFGQILEVTNVRNGKSVKVKVNDRGGFRKGNIELDLSEGAFKKIASVNQGVIKVTIKKI